MCEILIKTFSKVASPVSAAIMIAIGLIVLITLFALTIATMVFLKRRRVSQAKSNTEQAKNESQGNLTNYIL